jgi:DNA-binding Lrp family transcriptional regulator
MSLKLDIRDRRIIYELDINSRQTNRQIAKKLGISEQVVGYRIKRMLNEGLIKKFHIRSNNLQMGYMQIKTYMKFFNITPEAEEEMLREIGKNAVWLVSTRGSYDAILTVIARNIHEFEQRFQKINEKYGNYIYDKDVAIISEATTYSRAYLVPETEKRDFDYRLKGKPMDIDETDTAIISILSLNARMDAQKIAAQLKIGPDAVRYRIRNLVKQNIITGFSVNIDYAKADRTYYILVLNFHNMSKQKYAKVNEIALQDNNVMVNLRTVGDHDVEFELEISEKKELDDLLMRLRTEFAAELKNFELIEIIKEHEWNYYPGFKKTTEIG